MPRRYPPLFMVVRKELEVWLEKEDYRPGDRLPSEEKLSQLFEVSRVTIREALRTMEEDGIVVRSHGKGTFVAERRIRSILETNIGVTEMIEAIGYRSGTLEKRVRRKEATLFLAEKLSIKQGSGVILIERVRTADGRPVVYSVDAVPEWILRSKGANTKELRQYESVYSFLEERCEQDIKDSTAQLSAVASPRIAEKLNLQSDTAFFLVEQVDTDQNGQPIVYSREYFLGDIFEFKVRRRRAPLLMRGSSLGEKVKDAEDAEDAKTGSK